MGTPAGCGSIVRRKRHAPRVDRTGKGRFEADLNTNDKISVRGLLDARAIFSTRWHCNALEDYPSFRCSSSSDQTSSKQAVCTSSSATAAAIALPSI